MYSFSQIFLRCHILFANCAQCCTCIQVWNHVTGDCMKHMRVRGGREVTGLVHHIDKEKIFVTGWNKRISIFPDIANVHVRLFLIIVLGMLL